jgi:hypothetical protein
MEEKHVRIRINIVRRVYEQTYEAFYRNTLEANLSKAMEKKLKVTMDI